MDNKKCELAYPLYKLVIGCVHVDRLVNKLTRKYGLSSSFHPTWFPPFWELGVSLQGQPIIIEFNSDSTKAFTFISPKGNKYHTDCFDDLETDLSAMIEVYLQEQING